MQLHQGTYSAADLVQATAGRQLAGSAARRLGAVAIDSRLLAPGRGVLRHHAARDGHEFVPAAIARGAAGVVVQRPVEVPPGSGDPVVVEVADTLRALQDLARAVRRASGARVVAITGSAGKTTTKDAIAAVLGARYRVVKNRGNLNNHLGLPISLVELRTAPDVAVMELGMNHAGEIRVLVDIARPDVRVWTNVGDAHIGYFGSRAAIADAKAEILEQAGAGDDARLQRRRPAGHGPRRGPSPAGWSRSARRRRADVRATAVDDRGVAGIARRCRHVGGHAAAVDRDCRAAATSRTRSRPPPSASSSGCRSTAIAERLGALAPADHRGAVIRTPAGVTVLDDSLQLEPGGAAPVARGAGRQPSGRTPNRGARRDAGARRSQPRRCTTSAAAPWPPPASNVWWPSAAPPPARLAAAAVAAGMPAAGRHPRRHQRRGVDRGRRPRAAPATSCWSRARAASAPRPSSARLVAGGA